MHIYTIYTPIITLSITAESAKHISVSHVVPEII